ncbi:transmembrane emp24 domain-containing protein 3 isoform X6 [Anguilla rostrata]|uniref:transmembrane emp24 domain-containing protein 3 isoform X6 n=1 Tax=Anguilla rostrata TaxID=7938 RepID=UPI0030D29A02
MRLLGIYSLMLHIALVYCTELTFVLPDNDKQCFFDDLQEGVKIDIDYQVIAGGNYDIDCFVTDPQNNVLYQEKKRQYDSFSHTTTSKGVYKVCFSNEFSTFTHKTVYLDFRAGEEAPLLPDMNRATALTQMSLEKKNPRCLGPAGGQFRPGGPPGLQYTGGNPAVYLVCTQR